MSSHNAVSGARLCTRTRIVIPPRVPVTRRISVRRDRCIVIVGRWTKAILTLSSLRSARVYRNRLGDKDESCVGTKGRHVLNRVPRV